MGKIVKLTNGKYRTQVYVGRDEEGKQVIKTITCDTIRECKVATNNLLDKANTRGHGTVRWAIRKYINKSQMLSPTTLYAYERILKYAFKDIMNVRLDNLTADKMQDAVNKEARRVTPKGTQISPKTVKNEYGLLRTALLCEGYSFKVRLPRCQHKNKELPEPNIILDIIKGTDIELPCLLAMWMSLRLSEIMGITVQSIKGDKLYIDKVRVRVGKEEVLKPFAKTDASIRILPIPPYIKQLIYNTIEAQKTAQTGDFPLLPCTGNSIHHRFRKLMDKNGIDITFHDLRHLYASISLTMLGIPSKIVQVAGGWSSPVVLERIYSQAFKSVQDESFNRLNAYFEEMLTKS